MQVTRRQFILGGLTSLSTAASPALLRLLAGEAYAYGDSLSYGKAFSTLSRISFGPTLIECQQLMQMGLKAYLDSQLAPDDAQDEACNARLSRATLHIEYKAGDIDLKKPADPKTPVATVKTDPLLQGPPTPPYPALKEDRPLRTLHMPVEELWKLTDNSVKMDGKERNRPLQEVKAATWIRAVNSQWQLREVMVEFWHNHFNVNANGGQQIAATFPIYDALMRRNCFGNFRTFIEEVAKSAAMQFYLNNAKSKASPANENYAREMFELHTLGADHYYNSLYNRWREVPGAVHGRPIGYIDEDVYEAARAFTGWTIEDGSNTGRGTIFPKTGKFVYFDGWHDNYQKRVLGTEFDPNSPPMADGRKVLDLVSAHPGTALFLCTKLCRRFVSDNPPPELVKRVAKAWQQSAKKPDQIARVLKVIILSKEFEDAQGQKVKRPFEYAVSFLRATGADVAPNDALFGALSGTGYRQFEWPTPTGHPDIAEYWLNSNTMLSSWNLIAGAAAGNGKMAAFNFARETPPSIRTSGDMVSYWVARLTGRAPDAQLFAALMQFTPEPQNPGFVPDLRRPEILQSIGQMALTIGMLPEFQMRG